MPQIARRVISKPLVSRLSCSLVIPNQSADNCDRDTQLTDTTGDSVSRDENKRRRLENERDRIVESVMGGGIHQVSKRRKMRDERSKTMASTPQGHEAKSDEPQSAWILIGSPAVRERVC